MERRLQKLSKELKLSRESRARIRERLASQQTHQEVIFMKKRTLHLRKPLLAAVLAAAMIVTAFAVELTVGWENFMGRRPAEEAVTAVGASAVTGDYTLTLREAIVDDTGAAFLLALTRTDGGVLEGDPRLNGRLYGWDIMVDGEKPNMASDYQAPIRSEDGKTVYYYVEFEGQKAEDLLGKTITFLCDGVADLNWTQKEIEQVRKETVSLAPLTDTARQLDMSRGDMNRGENGPKLLALAEELSAQAVVPLTKMGEGNAQVAAVLFTNDGLPVVVVGNRRTQFRQGQYLTLFCTAATLTDTRTGEKWGCTSYTWWGGEEGFYFCDFEDCPMTAEDLPYFDVTIHYGAEKILSDQPVELSFSTNVGYQTTTELDEAVTFNYLGECALRLTGAKISTLRLTLTFDQMERVGWDRDDGNSTQWILLEKNGDRVPLSPPAIRRDEELGTGWIFLTGRSEEGDRVLLDPDQAEALLVGDTRIPLT